MQTAVSVIGHAAVGLVLALLFVGLLCCVDATMARLLRDVGGPTVLAALVLLHAVLFACASFATATDVTTGHGGGAAAAEPEGLLMAPQQSRARRRTDRG